jgi:hypothetical protein
MIVELAPVDNEYATRIGVLEKCATGLVEFLILTMSLIGLIYLLVVYR